MHEMNGANSKVEGLPLTARTAVSIQYDGLADASAAEAETDAAAKANATEPTPTPTWSSTT
jgi:hypothetical protein